jgi:hypothetical protein
VNKLTISTVLIKKGKCSSLVTTRCTLDTAEDLVGVTASHSTPAAGGENVSFVCGGGRNCLYFHSSSNEDWWIPRVWYSCRRNYYTEVNCSFLNVTIWVSCVKVKSSPATHHGSIWGERRYSSYSFSTSALDGGEWSASRPGRALLPGKGPPVPNVQEAGWAPEPVWTQRSEEKSFATAGDRISIARSSSP